MELVAGYPYWLIKTGLPYQYQGLSENKKCKVVIIGGGISGALTGFDVELLFSGDLQKIYGLDAACGILSNKGAVCNVYHLTHHILHYCVKQGLQVYDHTKIKTIQNKNDEVVVETEEGYTITAEHAVNAMGYEVVNFLDKKIVNLDCTYAIISETLKEKSELLQNKIMLWNTDDPYLYLYPTTDDRIIMGGRDEKFVNVKTMHVYLEKKTSLLERDFKKCFPGSSIKTEFAWTGVFGKTKDSLPYIGNHPKTPRIFYALGFGGNGITFSMVAAGMITDLLSGAKNSDTKIFSFAR